MTFDRYVMSNFLYVLGACFVTTFGLMVVIDLLDNIDDFLTNTRGQGTLVLVQQVVIYYSYRLIFFVDLAGPPLTVISVMVVLILMQRSRELHPLLAAGVPMYRILRPLILGPILVNLILVLNQEYLVPNVAHQAHGRRGDTSAGRSTIDPIYDFSTGISVEGDTLVTSSGTIENARFVLPAPNLVGEMTTLKAKTAAFRPGTAKRPPGWLLTEVSPPFSSMPLTERGRELLKPLEKPGMVFIASPVSPDLLHDRDSTSSMLSTHELLSRIRSPAFGPILVRRMLVEVHTRLTQPLINIVAVLLVIPLMVRKESRGLVIDSGLCGLFLGVLFGGAQACSFLGLAGVLSPDLAAWLPVIAGGTASTWVGWLVRT